MSISVKYVVLSMWKEVKNKAKRKILNLLEKFDYYPPARRRWQQYKKMLKAFYLKELYDQIRDIEGDIVECGVGYGGTLVILGILAKQENKGRRVYGFDSFEGFPETSQEDVSFRKPKKGEYGGASLRRAKKTVDQVAIPSPILIKGFFEDTLERFEGKIALLHIDADLYLSYKTVLNELFNKVSRGGIIAFDEYNDPKFPGATKAVDEFLRGRYKIQKGKYIDKYYIIKNKDIDFGVK